MEIERFRGGGWGEEVLFVAEWLGTGVDLAGSCVLIASELFASVVWTWSKLKCLDSDQK